MRVPLLPAVSVFFRLTTVALGVVASQQPECKFPFSSLHKKVKGVKLTTFLGQGFSGVVYRGITRATGEDVAVKFIVDRNEEEVPCVRSVSELSARFRFRESEIPQLIWEKCDDDVTRDLFIRPLRGFSDLPADPAFTVMELLPGDRYVPINPNFNPDTGTLQHLYLAVQALWAYGVLVKPPNAVVHRDWHFGNFQMRAADWRLKVYDFTGGGRCPETCKGWDLRQIGYWLMIATSLGGGLWVFLYKEAQASPEGNSDTLQFLRDSMLRLAGNGKTDSKTEGGDGEGDVCFSDSLNDCSQMDPLKSLLDRIAKGVLRPEDVLRDAPAEWHKEEEERRRFYVEGLEENGEGVPSSNLDRETAELLWGLKSFERWMKHTLPQPWRLEHFSAFKQAVVEMLEGSFDFDFELGTAHVSDVARMAEGRDAPLPWDFFDERGRRFSPPAGEGHLEGLYWGGEYLNKKFRWQVSGLPLVLPDDAVLDFIWRVFVLARQLDLAAPTFLRKQQEAGGIALPFAVWDTPCVFFDTHPLPCIRALGGSAKRGYREGEIVELIEEDEVPWREGKGQRVLEERTGELGEEEEGGRLGSGGADLSAMLEGGKVGSAEEVHRGLWDLIRCHPFSRQILQLTAKHLEAEIERLLPIGINQQSGDEGKCRIPGPPGTGVPE
uniref:Protein kinase domain-containing protein n=1 Tax=Chromera velia CCMP2878 TaxID=1169474 RepID=A0A0G4I8Y0_9ALVE|eukprot:Cvel_12014.t1-p1 / transcript=Cvel_12014.t1 / gene=Cvel_12014 / organism=Chromera_velia_CCMP2878 / gene_product=hypothetical protein / transcript_product=hypothetical protein / location=Cvel_scaffold771:32202-34519(+) / protein_length=663 / sequence_SO=supercontig / SO=protein_coding / is_pseudo=false